MTKFRQWGFFDHPYPLAALKRPILHRVKTNWRLKKAHPAGTYKINHTETQVDEEKKQILDITRIVMIC